MNDDYTTSTRASTMITVAGAASATPVRTYPAMRHRCFMIALLVFIGVSPSTQATLITTVGNGNGYDVSSQGAWDASSEAIWGDWDVSGDNKLGSDGFLFFGNFNNQTNQQGLPWGNHVSNDMSSYIASIGPGNNFSNIAYAFPSYGSIHDPVDRNQSFKQGGVATSVNGSTGDFHQLITFTVDESIPANLTMRVGLMTGIEGNTDGRWDPTALRISDGINTATVSDLPISGTDGTGRPSWVFFDVQGAGTYNVYAQQRMEASGAQRQATSISGITFDIIPEPATSGLLLLGMLMLLWHLRRTEPIRIQTGASR